MSDYKKKFGSSGEFLQGWTGKSKKELEEDEKNRKNSFSKLKSFLGMGEEKPEKKSKRKSRYTK